MVHVARSTKPLWLQFREAGAGPDEILAEFGIAAPAVPILKIAENLGVHLHFSRSLDADGKMIASGPDASKAARADIWVDALASSVRQRFTIAHELGHLMLHPMGEVYRGGGRGWTPQETEANDFAARLLMPEWLVRPYARVVKADASKLARVFRVSSDAMGIRLGKVIASL